MAKSSRPCNEDHPAGLDKEIGSWWHLAPLLLLGAALAFFFVAVVWGPMSR